MGAYPVPIKAPSVVKVDPHPVIFQFYKSHGCKKAWVKVEPSRSTRFCLVKSLTSQNSGGILAETLRSLWVFVTGWFFVLARWWQSQSPVYVFSWWGIVSAVGWIPSGLCTISAVPRLGVGMCVAVLWHQIWGKVAANRLFQDVSCSRWDWRRLKMIEVFQNVTFFLFFTECVARVPSRFTWGSGGEAVFAKSCVCDRNRSQPSATVRNRRQPSATVCVRAVRLSTVASASGVVLKACQVE